ncbi:MAG: carboxypeptidase regulatory-like domain-containing protein [bacterium]|nr:carboxypeptidase regulatory-like domain-containing protein [Candidatus Kapabacteria bacterium]
MTVHRATVIAALACIFGLSLTGCSSNNPQTPTGNDGVPQKGNLTGWVSLYNIAGDTISDKSGVTVKLVRTNFSTVTSANGRWTFVDIPSGTYEVSFEKSGFAELRVFGYQFVGGGEARFDEVAISETPTLQVTSFSLAQEPTVVFDTLTRRLDTLWTSAMMSWQGTFDRNPDDTSARIFIYYNTSPNVSNHPRDHVWYMYIDVMSNNPVVLFHKYQLFYNREFPSGTRIYSRTYVGSKYHTQMRDTSSANKYIMTSLGPASPVRELVMR